jgi:hypothetical protein
LQFSRADVEIGISALVDELVRAEVTSRIQIVGGAALMLQVGRIVLTSDIDILHAGGAEFANAVDKVARLHRWPTDWINSAANMWASNFDSEDDWNIHLSRGSVTVQVASTSLLLAMKLQAGRGRRDAEDIELLLAAIGVTSLKEASAIFDRYYPTETMAPKAMQQLIDHFKSE